MKATDTIFETFLLVMICRQCWATATETWRISKSRYMKKNDSCEQNA